MKYWFECVFQVKYRFPLTNGQLSQTFFKVKFMSKHNFTYHKQFFQLEHKETEEFEPTTEDIQEILTHKRSFSPQITPKNLQQLLTASLLLQETEHTD